LSSEKEARASCCNLLSRGDRLGFVQSLLPKFAFEAALTVALSIIVAAFNGVRLIKSNYTDVLEENNAQNKN